MLNDTGRTPAVGPTFLGKAVLIVFVVGVAVLGAHYLGLTKRLSGLLGGKETTPSFVAEKKKLEGFRDSKKAGDDKPALALPGTRPASPITGKPTVRTKVWAWNAQAGWFLANGGPETTENSAMEKYGVRMTIERQDDTNKLRDELLACAMELDQGKKDCDKGIHFTAVMGDQLYAQFAEWNVTFAKLASDLTLEVVGLGGRSDGEDAYLAPPAVAENPQAARGTVVLCAPREGDQNIVLYWAINNSIPVNPDFETYDADAVNFYAAPSYTKAAEMYNANVCESRPVVRNGKRTGERRKVCADSLATWTPGDVTATVGPNARGGLVRVWSTRQNTAQMPNTIIGIKRWNADHADIVEGMLAAITEGGEQVKSHRAALRRASEISYKIYNEESSDYWYEYFIGLEKFDAQGNKVQLGGSQVFNMADNLLFFGLVPGESDAFRITYETFGNWMAEYYPLYVAKNSPHARYEDVVNTTYLQAAARRISTQTGATVRKYAEDPTQITDVGARRDWTIEFETGRATFTPAARAELEELFSMLRINDVSIDIYGHTDSTGTVDGNMKLSENRAFAVQAWLNQKSPSQFPLNRMRIEAKGQSAPLVPNTTASNMAKNRRVEVVLSR